MKTCNKCGSSLPAAKFFKSKSNKDGLHGSCTDCLRKYYRARTARIGKRSSHRALALSRTEKSCKICGLVLPLSSFRKTDSTIDGRGSYCRGCEAESSAIRKSKSRKEKDKEKQRMIDLLGGSCQDCGLSPSDDWPLACFDFHHNGDKKFSISQAIKAKESDNLHIEEEIKKCTVLCSNCHKRHHARSRVKDE